MKRTLITLAAVAGLVVAGAATAQSGADAFKAKGCATGHAPDTKKMGPSLKDIAAKNKPDQADAISAKLKDGKGHPKVAGTDAEIKSAVLYTITGK
jgi:cytochrome c